MAPHRSDLTTVIGNVLSLLIGGKQHFLQVGCGTASVGQSELQREPVVAAEALELSSELGISV